MRRVKDDGDGGAVAVLFALMLIVLVGFVGAGVDVTSAYAKTQEVQNAADAGALAAAQQCASKAGCTDNAALAQELAVSNIRNGIDVSTVVTYPTANTVRVVAETDHQNYFLGLFGHNVFRVGEAATARWTSAPKAGPATLPVTISECNFMNASGAAPNLDVKMTVYLPKMNNGESTKAPGPCPSGTAPPGGFGWLDATGDCESAVVTVGSTYTTGSDPGFSSMKCLEDLLPGMVAKQEVVLIPIYADRTGSGQHATYTIERFAAYKLTGYHVQTFSGGDKKAGEACASAPPGGDYTKTCIVGRFISWAELGEDYETGAPKTEVAVVTLDD